MSSLRRNLAWGVLNNALNIAFPLVTYPYVARILGPVEFGKVNFALAFAMSFAAFSAVVQSIYAMREAARRRDEPGALDRLFSEFLILNLSSGAVAFVAYLAVFLLSPPSGGSPLLLLFSLQILFSAISFDWLFQARERFFFITLRNFASKAVFLLAILVLVRSREHAFRYAVLLLVGMNLSSILNLFFLKGLARFTGQGLHVFRHLRGILVFFGINALSVVLTNVDKLLLGRSFGVAWVGQYAVAEKIILLCATLSASLGVVLLPRLAHHAAAGEMDSYYRKLGKSLHLTLAAVTPLAAFLAVAASPVVRIVAGGEYGDAAFVLRILAPNLVLIGIASVLGHQMLLSVRRETSYLLSLAGSAMFFLPAAWVSARFLGSTALFLSVVAAYLVQVTIQAILVREGIRKIASVSSLLVPILSTVVAAGAGFFVLRLLDPVSPWVALSVAGASMAVVYSSMMLLFRDEVAVETVDMIRRIASGR